jgi:hypothetical protein
MRNKRSRKKLFSPFKQIKNVQNKGNDPLYPEAQRDVGNIIRERNGKRH